MTQRPEEQEAVYTTIVGGRPPGCGTKVGNVPRGIEILVKKASVDPAFKELLLKERSGAAATIELELDPAEKMMIDAIPEAQLTTIVDRTTVPEKQRSAFLGKMATSMVLALGIGLMGCSEEPGKTAGIKPDQPAKKKVERRKEFTKGIQPDRPRKYEAEKSEEEK